MCKTNQESRAAVKNPTTRAARCALFVACAVAALCGTARASWIWIPPEVLIDDAEYVVTGEMTEVNPAAGTGVLKVADVLKGPDRTTKTIPVSFSGRGGPMLSTAIFFKDGQDGVWIMSQKDDAGRFRLNGHPGQHMDRDKLADAVHMIRKLDMTPWGEPVGGIAVRTLLCPGTGTGNSWHIHVGVKNVSDKPIQVPEHVAHAALRLTVTGPDGDTRPLPYPVPRIMLPPGGGLRELAPGESFYANPQGLQVPGLDAFGAYKVDAAYTFLRAQGHALAAPAKAPQAIVHYGLTSTVTTDAQAYGPGDTIEATLGLTNITDADHHVFDVSYSPEWNWEFVAVGGSPSYRAQRLEQADRVSTEFKGIAAGQTLDVEISLPPGACRFQRVYGPNEERLAQEADRDVLPPGRYVAIVRRTLGTPRFTKAVPKNCWSGDVEAHTAVIEITDPDAAPAGVGNYRVPGPLTPGQLQINRYE